jgi:DNA-binding CsgD family transcriptional regulator
VSNQPLGLLIKISPIDNHHPSANNMHQYSENFLGYNFDFFERMNDPVFVADNNGSILYSNDTFRKFFLGANTLKQVRFFQLYIRDESSQEIAYVGIINELGQTILDLSKCLWSQPNTSTTKISTLSSKELQILHLIALGNTSKEIAKLLGNSSHTIVFHQKSIYLKLGARSKIEAINAGKKLGLLRDQFSSQQTIKHQEPPLPYRTNTDRGVLTGLAQAQIEGANFLSQNISPITQR